MVRCCNCGKESYSVKRCVRCRGNLCSKCASGNLLCGECTVFSDEEQLVYDYFKDKYAEGERA